MGAVGPETIRSRPLTFYGRCVCTKYVHCFVSGDMAQNMVEGEKSRVFCALKSEQLPAYVPPSERPSFGPVVCVTFKVKRKNKNEIAARLYDYIHATNTSSGGVSRCYIYILHSSVSEMEA